MKKQKSINRLKKDCWIVFSKYIRLRDSKSGACQGHNGYAKCYTCGIRKPWREMDAGHFRSRQHNNTLFDEINVHAQCKRCNIFRKGALDDYAYFLQLEYGSSIVKKLRDKSFIPKKFTRQELENTISYYKEKIFTLNYE